MTALPNDEARRLRQIADDSHLLLIESNAVTHAHAANRNVALRRLANEYALTFEELADLTGIPERTVRGVLFGLKNKARKR